MLKMTIAGVHRYTVRVTDMPIYDEGGDELDGLSIESRRLILISCRVPRLQREEVLSHEIEHCWAFHVPPATDDEQRCQLTATITQQLREDFERQGGVEELLDIEPMPISLPFKSPAVRKFMPPAMPPRDWWECGGCGSRMMCGSIESGIVEFHEGVQQYQVPRWFCCEVCDTLNVWREITSQDGQATGVLVQIPAPRLLRGIAAREWLAHQTNEAVT
jgi:hypothetical protein